MPSSPSPTREPPELQLRVRFAETDQMGVAHHAIYPVWMEAGRVQWMRAHGLSYVDIEADGVSLAVSALELSYRAAAHFDDLITVTTRLVTARSRLLRFEYALSREADAGADASLISTGATVHVPTDRQGKAVRLPAKWLAPIAALAEPAA